MAIRKLLRETAFQLARSDLASFLADHEEDLVVIFREEMAELDRQIPEENLFIDIKMVPLGEVILRAALHAITRFLTEDYATANNTRVSIPVSGEDEGSSLTLKDT